MHNKVYLFFVLIILLLGISACSKEFETKEEFIQRALSEKIKKHTKRKTDRCTKDLLEKAATIADSILLIEALQLDSLQEKLPIVPPKPNFIEPSPSRDSLAVEPFLDSM